MNNRITVLVSAILLTVVGCGKNERQSGDGTIGKTFNISSQSMVKSTLNDDFSVNWSAGDCINYYSSPSGNISSLTVEKDCHEAALTFRIGKNDGFIVATAGTNGILTHNADGMLLNKTARPEQSGKFSDSHVAVARTTDLESGKMKFYNITPMIQFSFRRDDVASVLFTANGGARIHDRGFAKVSFDSDGISVTGGDNEGGSSILVKTGGAGTFYMATLPAEFDGFSIICLDSHGRQLGGIVSESLVTLERNSLLILGELDSLIRNNVPDDPRKALADSMLSKIFSDTKSVCMGIIAVSGDDIIYENSFGFKDRSQKTLPDTSSIFRIASVSKTFISAAVMQLVENGKLGLDDDVKDILGIGIRHPQYPSVPITVRMLLTHSASIEDGSLSYKTITYLDPLMTDSAKMVKNKIYLDGVKPGTAYNYTNRGANLCAAVVEKVSGMRLDEYYRKNLLEPLGIYDSGLLSCKLNKKDMVTLYKGYKGGDSGEYTTVYDANSVAYLGGDPDTTNYTLGYDTFGLNPAGSMVMSTRSLAKWMVMLKNQGVGANGVRVLKQSSVSLIETPSPLKSTYGFYCMKSTTVIPGCRMDGGHNGSAYGLYSRILYDRADNFGMVALVSGTDNSQQTSGGPSVYVDSFRQLYDIFLK